MRCGSSTHAIPCRRIAKWHVTGGNEQPYGEYNLHLCDDHVYFLKQCRRTTDTYVITALDGYQERRSA